MFATFVDGDDDDSNDNDDDNNNNSRAITWRLEGILVICSVIIIIITILNKTNYKFSKSQ